MLGRPGAGKQPGGRGRCDQGETGRTGIAPGHAGRRVASGRQSAPRCAPEGARRRRGAERPQGGARGGARTASQPGDAPGRWGRARGGPGAGPAGLTRAAAAPRGDARAVPGAERSARIGALGPREVSRGSGRTAGGIRAPGRPRVPGFLDAVRAPGGGAGPRAGLPPGGRDADRRRSVGIQLPASACAVPGAHSYREGTLSRSDTAPGPGRRLASLPAPAPPLPGPGETRRPAALLPSPSVASSLGWLWCREKQTVRVAGC